MEWTRCTPEASQGGNCGGDVQVGDVWDARWSRPLDDGTTAMVTRSFYPAKQGCQKWLERRTEYLICSDPADPGGTETWSELSFGDLRADLDAKQEALSATAPTDADWADIAPPWAGKLR